MSATRVLLPTLSLALALGATWALFHFAAGVQAAAAEPAPKKVVFVAGTRSHGYGAHEHYAGSVILAKRLQAGMPNFTTIVHRDGWPKDADAFDGADAVVVYADGGRGHPALPHLDQLQALMDAGVGLVCLHYAVEVPKNQGGAQFLDWLGGYFETNWSVNPHWEATFSNLSEHPIVRGVQPFTVYDEWYYHMRFPDQMGHVTPILTALPPASSLSRPDGPHSGNPYARAAVANQEPQHVAWAVERPDGGRGFGFTGGHHHINWGHDDFRRTVLNAIVWAAHGEVPAGGVPNKTPSQAEIESNQDYPKPAEDDAE